ncbi:hypothetical protein KPL71_017543 [Citrus sinensis]|uniref:Uncharacterized protein n=1 Tax=Citrus sinensis TaxID=2711 RepID=A0ACB8JRR0_CITSI|nr:hypothetical protein KPL71_017543 [Citrus sinensis]
MSKANTVIPKPIQWKDINLPDEWILEGATAPVIPKQLELNTELQNVTQYSDGKVKLSFRRSSSSRFSDKDSSSSIHSLERKFSKIPSVINLPFQSQPRFSTSDMPSSSIHSVDYATSVPHPIYTSSQHEKRQEEKEPSPPTSPTKKATKWNLSGSGRIIESEHPPLRSITIDHGEPPVEIKASPYKIHEDPETDLDSIIQQNNFCNANLSTIGNQLTRIENQFQQSTITVSPIAKPVTSKSDSDKKLKEPIFKPFQVSKTSQKLVHESKSDFAKAIREQLDRIKAASSSSSKVQVAPDSTQSSKIGVLEHDSMYITSSDIEAFTEELIPKTNKIHWELALPTVKSPPDLAIDNRPSALNKSRFNASSVYEWNIDGMSEYNILRLLQQMTMAANAYKTQSGTSDKAIAEILIAGFTGQLKGWWDHLLTQQKQLDILSSIQTDEDKVPILDEFNNPIQDAVATLILTISLHFIGDPSHLRDKNSELLHNLRCRKLSDFQSYKTTFFTRLFLRDDASHITWKEKLLAGLPTLLGEKNDLSDEILSKVAPLLVESSDSESSMTEDSEPLQIDELIDSDTSVSSNGDSDTDFYLKKINVLTKEQETFLELIKHISDPALQNEYLDKLLKTLDLNNKAETSKVPIIKRSAYDLTEILGFLPLTIKEVKAQETFLTQKSKAQSLLASAKTEDEYFRVMQQLLATRSETSVASSFSSSSGDAEPFISLGDENEDDCFGIFSPIKH